MPWLRPFMVQVTESSDGSSVLRLIFRGLPCGRWKVRWGVTVPLRMRRIASRRDISPSVLSTMSRCVVTMFDGGSVGGGCR